MWARDQDFDPRLRSYVRRGTLVQTYTDGKIMTARVRTGTGPEGENDRLEVIWPAGFIAHVPSGPGTEILTTDIEGDPSRRVVSAIFGDRSYIPMPEEGEAFLYTPGDPSRFIRIKRPGSGGRDAGLQIEIGDIPVSLRTAKGMTIEATEGVAIEAAQGVVIKAPLVRIEGRLEVTEDVTASTGGGPVSLSQHVHGGVDRGAASTDPPIR